MSASMSHRRSVRVLDLQLTFVLFQMYNYFINFQSHLLGDPLPLGALSARLVRLRVNPARVTVRLVMDI